MDQYSEGALAKELSTHTSVPVSLDAQFDTSGLIGTEILALNVSWEGAQIPFALGPEMDVRQMTEMSFKRSDDLSDEERLHTVRQYLKSLKCKLVFEGTVGEEVSVTLLSEDGQLLTYLKHTNLILPADH